jgi:hypothetical protein
VEAVSASQSPRRRLACPPWAPTHPPRQPPAWLRKRLLGGLAKALKEELPAPQWQWRRPLQGRGPCPRGFGLLHRWCGHPRWGHGWPAPSPARRPEQRQLGRAGAKWPCLVAPPPRPADEKLLAALGPPGPRPPSPLPKGRLPLALAGGQQPLPLAAGQQLPLAGGQQLPLAGGQQLPLAGGLQLPLAGGLQLRSALLLRERARRQVRLPAARRRWALLALPGQLGALRAAGRASGPPFRPSAGRGQLGLPRCSRSGSSPRSP